MVTGGLRGAAEGAQEIRPHAVAIYIRWSTEEQGEGTTLDEQAERCRNYVLSQGWQVNDRLIFIDDGYSGATMERPGIARLRALVQQGQVDCVVSLKIDRLSRSLVDCVDLVLREWDGICYYKSVSQPVNSTDELGRVFFAILAGFAEYERALIRERTFSGLLRRVAEGAYWGSPKPAFGYVRVGKAQVAISQTEAQVVRMIFQIAVSEGLGSTAIAARLNRLGIPGPTGKGWWGHTVRRILRDQIYIGYPQYGKVRTVPKARTKGGNPIRHPRAVPLITPPVRREDLVLVSDADFAAAQQLLRELSDKHQKAGRAARSNHRLTGLLRCRCGGPMLTGYDRLGRRYYRCQQRGQASGGIGCTTGGGFIYAHRIEPIVAEAIKGRCADPVAMSGPLYRQWQEERDGNMMAETWRRLLADLAAKGKRLEADRARILRQARRGEITVQELRALARDLDSERQDLAEQRSIGERHLEEAAAGQAGFETLMAWVNRVDPWNELALETQKELLRHTIDRIVVFKRKGRHEVPEVDLYWRV